MKNDFNKTLDKIIKSIFIHWTYQVDLRHYIIGRLRSIQYSSNLNHEIDPYKESYDLLIKYLDPMTSSWEARIFMKLTKFNGTLSQFKSSMKERLNEA